MANKLLGEVEIELAGEKVKLKPEYQGIYEMESLSGKSLALLVNEFATGMPSLKSIVAVVYGGMVGAAKGENPPLSYHELAQQIVSDGHMNFFRPCLKIVGAAYSGRPVDDIEPSGDSKKNDIQGEEQNS